MFSYYFCLMIEGSGSGSVSLTNGFGSGMPENIWPDSDPDSNSNVVGLFRLWKSFGSGSVSGFGSKTKPY